MLTLQVLPRLEGSHRPETLRESGIVETDPSMKAIYELGQRAAAFWAELPML